MAKLLHIEASPRKERSASIEVAKVFMEAYLASHPGDQVETLDLWSYNLPPFDGATINAKYAILHGLDHSAEQASAWGAITEVFAKFNAADKYIFSVPMWNFGIPYTLKHFIDVITQPGLSFSFSATEGFKGLVTGKPAAVVYSRGSEYPQGSPMEAMDLQKPYLDCWLRFIGFTDIHPILVEPTLEAPDKVAQVKSAAKELATNIANNF